MPTAKETFWIVALSALTVIAINYASRYVPVVAKATANNG